MVKHPAQMASIDCLLQGLESGVVKAQLLIAAVLNADHEPSPDLSHTHQAWQAQRHSGAVTCLLAHSCTIFDEFDREEFTPLLISGCKAGTISATRVEDGSPFFTLHLHTDEVGSNSFNSSLAKI